VDQSIDPSPDAKDAPVLQILREELWGVPGGGGLGRREVPFLGGGGVVEGIPVRESRLRCLIREHE
jgi:hypothetical protein